MKPGTRVGAIVRKETKGQKLVLAGVKPMSGYENLVRGTAPAHLDEPRRIYRAGLARATAWDGVRSLARAGKLVRGR